MVMRMTCPVIATALVLGLAGFASADNILTINGPNGAELPSPPGLAAGAYTFDEGVEYLAQTWTQSSAYDHVDISAAIANTLGDSSIVTAYLTNFATVFDSVDVSDPTSGDALVPLFSG